MTEEQIKSIIESQRQFFKTNATLPVKFRIEALKKLYREVKNNSEEICSVLTKDLGKSGAEGFMCEVGLVLTEISYMIKHTKTLQKTKKFQRRFPILPQKVL